MCMCDWPDNCGGSGVLNCEGCGGDQCVCRCGGEMSCDSCDACDHLPDLDDLDDFDDGPPGEPDAGGE